MLFYLFCGSEKAEAKQAISLLLNLMEMSSTPCIYVSWALDPPPRLVRGGRGSGICLLFFLLQDLARKVTDNGKVLRELKCGCYGDVLCCE